MASFRDRFLTPQVARAITSPSAIVATGGGIAIGVLAFGNPIGAVAVGLAAFAARVALAVPRATARRGIDLRELSDPWHSAMRDILDAAARFERALEGIRPGPLRDRLADVRGRLDAAVDEAWKTAHAGEALSRARAQIDGGRLHAELAATRTAAPTDRSERTIAAIEAQLAATERMDRTIADARDRLRLLDARVDETVTRAIELSVTQTDDETMAGLGDEVDSIVGEMEALRLAVEETRRAGSIEPPPPMPGTAGR